MRNVFVLTDIGTNPDDTLALLMALRSKELNVLGIATNFDPQGERARLVNMLLKEEGYSSIPIGEGGIPSHIELKFKSEYFGPQISCKDQIKKSAQLLEEVLGKNQGIDIVTLGPLSDFSSVLLKNSSISKNVHSWIAMGGAAHGEEYNFCSDPNATSIILRSPFLKRIVPVDLTRQIYLRDEELDRINLPKDFKKQFMDQCQKWKSWYGRKHIYLNDPLAIASLLKPEMFLYQKADMRLKKVQGCWETEIIFKSQSSLDVATQVNRDTFFKMFWKLLG